MGKRGPQKREPVKRVSGIQTPKEMKYSTRRENGLYDIDTDKIKAICEDYVDASKREYTRIVNIKGSVIEETAYKPISYVGLRIALGISKQAYSYWKDGYVSAHDKDSDDVVYNEALVDALRVGDEEVTRYLTEEGDNSDMQRRIALLKSHGEIAEPKQEISITGDINLGKWGKWGK